MAKVITIQAPPYDISESAKTYLTAAASAAATVISVKNNTPSTDFAALAYTVMGTIGDENCEIRQISTVSGVTTINYVGSALQFAHLKNEPVTYIPYDKVNFVRRTTDSGDPSSLATVDMEVSSPIITYYQDTSGDDDYWYGARYYNSQTGTYSEALADVTLSLASQSGAYATVDEVRNFSGFRGNNAILDEHFQELIDDAENTINGYIGKIYTLPLASVPGLIRQLCWYLAGGNMLLKEYGAEGLDTQRDGEKWIRFAKDILQKIAEGDIGLFDSDGSELAKISGIVGDYDNVYTSDTEDRGDLFNLKEETFQMEDPDDPA